MSRFDLSAGPSSHMGFTATSGAPDVKWVRPDGPTYRATPISKSQATERSERANAMIAIALTLACTVLALYDLFLLAAGV